MNRLFMLLVLLSVMLHMPVQAASSDVDFKGTLVAEPCTVATGGDGENVLVDFGTIPDKNFYFYTPPRTWQFPFHILLKDCDLSLGSQVKVTFTGTEDAEQPGLLALSSRNGVDHLAIGIQAADGGDIAVNQQTKGYALNSGTTELKFSSYIQASDAGVKNRTVGKGTFEAVTTFLLEYP
ncbi:fimbrial protein [Pantoea brenneri]|uniref:fimbrial protein n=1 Tax=Pantoea brenneri TaxID=472694 RepID=UPI00289E21E3|nr:fimbrial protein [Pantoea brenneri]